MNDVHLFGYFNDASDTPAYDPGLDVVCIYCRQKLELPVRTTSLLVPGDDKSYFYRVHLECGQQMAKEDSVTHYDGLIIDTIDLPEMTNEEFSRWLDSRQG